MSNLFGHFGNQCPDSGLSDHKIISSVRVETPFKTNTVNFHAFDSAHPMASTPFRDDPLPSYLENTKSTAYRWQQDDMTDSTAHPSVGGGDTTRDHEIPSRTLPNPVLFWVY